LSVGGLQVLAVLFALAGVGCGADESGLLVRFLSDRTIPDEAETLEVVIADGADGTVLDVATYDLVPLAAFPATLGVVRGPDTPAEIRIEATLRVGDEAVASGGAVTTFLDGANRQVDVQLVE